LKRSTPKLGCIEITAEEIARANAIAEELLSRSLDELSSQTQGLSVRVVGPVLS
jgi:hypothetical protein